MVTICPARAVTLVVVAVRVPVAPATIKSSEPIRKTTIPAPEIAPRLVMPPGRVMVGLAIFAPPLSIAKQATRRSFVPVVVTPLCGEGGPASPGYERRRCADRPGCHQCTPRA
jgi:hypothetical protein